jgi:hypothetical protein
MGGGDKILFHAVGHVRLYAAGELTDSPDYDPSYTQWGDRFPWACTGYVSKSGCRTCSTDHGPLMSRRPVRSDISKVAGRTRHSREPSTKRWSTSS